MKSLAGIAGRVWNLHTGAFTKITAFPVKTIHILGTNVLKKMCMVSSHVVKVSQTGKTVFEALGLMISSQKNKLKI